MGNFELVIYISGIIFTISILCIIIKSMKCYERELKPKMNYARKGE